MRNRAQIVSILSLAITFVAGCGTDGPPMGDVSGTVTLDGEPLPNAIVEFTPLDQNGAPSYGRTDEDGEYELRFSATRDGAFLGKHQVRIRREQEEDEDGVPIPGDIVLPARYNTQSELTFTVEEGSNTADFPLESSGQSPQN